MDDVKTNIVETMRLYGIMIVEKEKAIGRLVKMEVVESQIA